MSTTSRSTPSSIRAMARFQDSPKKPTAAPTRSRPWSSLEASGYWSDLTKSLRVIRPLQPALLVDQRQLLDLVPGQQRHRVGAGDADRAGDQRHLRHHVADQPAGIALEPHVAVGDDAEQLQVAIDDRHTRDPVAPAHRVGLADRGVRGDGDRLVDHAGLGPLDHVDLVRLVLDRQVAVDHAEAALAGDGHRHPGLGDRVHRRGDQRHPDGDPLGHPRRRCRPRRG